MMFDSNHTAWRWIEVGSEGLDPMLEFTAEDSRDVLIGELSHPGPDRLWYVADAFRAGMTVDEVFEHSSIDPWFLVQIEDLVRCEEQLATTALTDIDAEAMRRLKRKGFSGPRLAS